MFKPGSIRKIEVINFVTYSHAELYPGPNLNMLVGPNGTGKSTIVAAIILGLGGCPKTVGRGVKVSEYVKHGCEEATIRVHLQGAEENEILKVSRAFNVQEKSTWHINNKKVLLKDVVSYIEQFNIQVDNLCQFLPQDRVQEFAKLNQQELLKQVQVALCKNDLIAKQEALVECRENQKNFDELINRNNAKLQENQDANLRLEGKIENFARKKKFLAGIQDIDRKVAWLEYDQVYAKMSETKADLKKATQLYEKHKKEIKPIDREIQAAKKVVSELQQTNSTVTRSARESESACKAYLNKITQSKAKIRDIENDMNVKVDLIEQRNREIEEMASKTEEMKAAQQQLLHQCGNDEQIQQKTTKITNEIKKYRHHVSELQNQKDDLVASRQTKAAQLRASENECRRLENVKQQRLNYLQRLNQHAYEAVMWLRQNKNLFKSEVFEPIMLELNVLDPKNAIYVENVLPMRDRLAFTCTNKDDMNNLIRYLRNDKKLVVNVLYAGDEERVFRPAIPIEQLRKYGLYSYINSMISAPDPIMRYLCKTHGIHNIPVGTAETNRHFQDLPQQISVFFSDAVRYSVSRSRYTNAKSTRQNDIHSDGSLGISLDVLHLERLKGQIEELTKSCGNCDGQLKEYSTQINLINEKIAKIGEELKHINGVKQQVQQIESRIAAMRQKVREMRQTATSREDILRQGKHKIAKVVRGMRQFVVDVKACCKTLSNLRTKSNLNIVKTEKARRAAAYLENKSLEARRLMQDSEQTMNAIRESFANVKAQAKAALQKGKNLSKGFTPDDGGFDEFRESQNQLSPDLEVLQEEKNSLAAKIECLNTADDDELQEYEKRLQAIETLRTSIERAHLDLSKATGRMDQLEAEWLGPLRLLVSEINTNFAGAFERMGCAGEVSINAGDDEKEFAKYGLRISVTYRNGEPMQELNSVVQSGGERAVATAVFMLSLQELTPVPFRCVDEINQGMDSDNERRVFDLLVKLTDQTETAQYFLATPKLVPKLTFSRSMVVHVIQNGPYIEPDRKWGVSRFCNPKGLQLH